MRSRGWGRCSPTSRRAGRIPPIARPCCASCARSSARAPSSGRARTSWPSRGSPDGRAHRRRAPGRAPRLDSNAIVTWEALAFDFGGTKARCGLVSRDGRLGPTRVQGRPRSDDGPRWLARMLDEGRGLLAEAGPGAPRAVGVSFGGPVDDEGRVFSMHVAGWEKVDLRQSMREAFGLPCLVDNDANLGALGEQRFGAGRDTAHLAYFTVSTGVGGGVVLHGKVHRGAHGIAGEFGHIPVRPFDLAAPECACGKRGCVESLASGRAEARLS